MKFIYLLSLYMYIFLYFSKFLGLKILIMQVYVEGTHIIVPWFERPIIYDVRARPHLVESTSGSRDLQMVNAFLVSVTENYILLLIKFPHVMHSQLLFP